MRILIKYIVFFVLIFNIISANASNVITEFEDENSPQYISADFKGALNLPHPIMLHLMLDNKNKNTIGRLVAIAYYFEAKYKGNAIEYDFSDDVAYIFPDLSPSEIEKKTSQIRMLIRTYRWGRIKYKQIAEELLAPKPTPIIIGDDEYAFKGSIDYIPVPEDSYAIINEFKKVVSYSENPKDIEAMELYRQKQLDKPKNKTNFDKFKSMVNKIEFSKIHRYGIDLPNPFMGNAGIGEWVEDEGFKVRAISELAQINNIKDFIIGIHIDGPSHRFILGNNLDANLQKPQIELIETNNIASYELLYPIPYQFIDEMMIGGYANDFAFPIKITTIDPRQGISLVAKTTFQSCDDRMKCIKKEFITPLIVEQGSDNTSSSMKNFIKQTYYDIPNDKNNNIHIEKIYGQLSQDKKSIDSIKLVIDISAKPKNISLFIEDTQNTQFMAPHINIHNKKVYVSVTPTSNQDKLSDKDITVSFKLNNFESLRQTIKLKTYSEQIIERHNFMLILLLAFFSGLIFNITPIGLCILCLNIHSSYFNTYQRTPKYWQKICITLLLGLFLTYSIQTYFDIDLFWGMQYNNIKYLGFCIAIMLCMIISIKYKHILLLQNHHIRSIISVLIIVILLPVSNTFGLLKTFNQLLYTDNLIKNYIVLSCFIIGIIIPYITIALIIRKKESVLSNQKLNNWSYHIINIIGRLYLMYLLIILCIQITPGSILKTSISIFILFILYNYFYAFTDALYRTQLTQKQKIISEKFAIIIICIITIFSINTLSKHAIQKHQQTPILPSQELINEKINSGKTVIVGITSDWSILNTLNNITVLNKYNLKNLEKNYNLEYMNINVSDISPEIRKYISKYNKSTLPVYVLYTLNTNRGFVLPSLLKDTSIGQTIQNFKY